MTHPCLPCRFAYTTTCDQKVGFYNALLDEMAAGFRKIKEPCCGATPGGCVLDHNQPKCSIYSEKK